MAVRYFSLVIGLIYSVLGFTGLIPSLVSPAAQIPEIMKQVGVTDGIGYLYGLFPINAFEASLYLVVGLTGIAGYVAGTEAFARLCVDTLAVWLGFIGILGLIPVANTFFGLMPLYGNDVWLHLGSAIAAAYFGFYLDRGRRDQDPSVPDDLKPEPLSRTPFRSDS
ncbi:DUF4383 domain-containing protein [cf. Phormidesmis sp. LEGE 11477]|uniref:DUF4383 domain-containing protein n=1 Tax=cf. Phormidesmis sp. LEGE 11477 TaxID=1828680 RepID=UPI0018804F7F|nr:DUF4383 domain-containing protein [cf. Phormidesmis sp. LEGE 11477]MBE9060877.1 DUF4383 domain-containing protein [cf. Phormidesmis sp. LEGE 11477]